MGLSSVSTALAWRIPLNRVWVKMDSNWRAAAISHGGLTVTIAENQQVSQPNPLAGGRTAVTNNSTINVQQDPGRMFKLDTGATLDDLVRAVNQVGVAPGDLMAILEALQQAGAIQGQLVIL